MGYWKNLIKKFPKTESEKQKIKELRSATEHFDDVLVWNKQQNRDNDALVWTRIQNKDAKNELKEIKEKISERRWDALFGK